ncbi:MAG: hypothetical protein R3Y44_06380 [Rikenellaceae bacterium]
MKAVKSTRFNNDDMFAGDTPKRGTKLTPNKKSGKERHHLYQSLEEDEDDIDQYIAEERESILDYIDDGDDFDEEDDEDFDDDELDEEED